MKSSPQYPPELRPLLLRMCRIDIVRYSKYKHIKNPNSSHFETIGVKYYDWKYKYRHDAEKVCASLFSTIRNLEIVEKEYPMCLKEEVSTRTMMQSHGNSRVQGRNTFQHFGHQQDRHQGQSHAQVQQHTQANNHTSAEKTIKIWIIHTMRFLRRNQCSFQMSAKSIFLSQKRLADLSNA